jgi:hypothetical protein
VQAIEARFAILLLLCSILVIEGHVAFDTYNLGSAISLNCLTNLVLSIYLTRIAYLLIGAVSVDTKCQLVVTVDLVAYFDCGRHRYQCVRILVSECASGELNGVRPPISGRVESVKSQEVLTPGQWVRSAENSSQWIPCERTLEISPHPPTPGQIRASLGRGSKILLLWHLARARWGCEHWSVNTTKLEFSWKRYYKRTQNRAVRQKQKSVRYKKTNYQ